MLKKIIKWTVLLLILCLIIIAVLGVGYYYNWWKNGDPDGMVNISVDGVSEMFEDLTVNQDTYTDIFDNPLLSHLKYCHDTYDAKFVLYCYYEADDFNLSMVPDTYRETFADHADWLTFGFCWRSDADTDEDITPDRLAADFALFYKEIARITGSAVYTLRLDDCVVSREALAVLKDHGVTTFLTVSDKKAGYYFEKDTDAAVLQNDCYIDKANDTIFLATDLCLDEGRINAVYTDLIRTALNKQQHSLIAVCAHESEFGEDMAEKIENVCRFAKNYDYEYTIFETSED